MRNKGFSLIEMLIVLTIFTVIAILATQSIFLTLRGTRKTENMIKVRENVDYALGVMERNLRNAEVGSIFCGSNNVNFTDSEGNSNSFTIESDVDGNGYMALNSDRLTSDEVNITNFRHNCTGSALVEIGLAAESAISGVESGTIEAQTQIVTRDYE